jgi:hypothetical protein
VAPEEGDGNLASTISDPEFETDVSPDNWVLADAKIDPAYIWDSDDKYYFKGGTAMNAALSAYLTSMYFAYSTLTTVGYGDISAHTDFERSIAILSLISGSVIYAVLVGFVNNLVDSSDVKETEYQKRLTNVNTFMNNHHLPSDLRGRIRRYVRASEASAKKSQRQWRMDDLLLSFASEASVAKTSRQGRTDASSFARA